MVTRVTTKKGSLQPAARALLGICSKLPWEALIVGSTATAATVGVISVAKPRPPALVSQEPPTPQTTMPPTGTIAKPGCSAADAALQARAYLEELSKGSGGFGVLRLAEGQLNEGARAADQLNRPHLAASMREIAGEITSVRDKEKAAAMARRLDPVVDEAWRLGRVCGLTRK